MMHKDETKPNEGRLLKREREMDKRLRRMRRKRRRGGGRSRRGQ